MFKPFSKLFKPSSDRNEAFILDKFGFLLIDYGFSYAKNDLGNALDKNGKFIFYGPLLAYQLYNDSVSVNILYLVQREDYNVYITDKYSTDQVYIKNGLELPEDLEYNLSLLAIEIRSSLLNDGTIFGRKIK